MPHPLRVLLYADLRTNHALAWLEGLHDSGIEVAAVSSQLTAAEFAQAPDIVARTRHVLVGRSWNRSIRTAFKPLGEVGDTSTAVNRQKQSRFDKVQVVETAITPLRLRSQSRLIRSTIDAFRPDLVHALRLPYEGLIALHSARPHPVVISCWGQDFSRQAARDPLLGGWIQHSLHRAAGLHVDAAIDLERARAYGFAGAPVLHAAGNFGVRRDRLRPSARSGPIKIVYPRGRRQYIQHDLFLDMVSSLTDSDDVECFAVGLQGDPQTESLHRRLGSPRLRVYPELDSESYLSILRQADLVVSPSLSDGTPNSLLEALATGASIFATDIPSVRALLVDDAWSSLLRPHSGTDWVNELRTVLPQLPARRQLIHDVDRVPAIHDWEANRDRVPDFYRSVIERARSVTHER